MRILFIALAALPLAGCLTTSGNISRISSNPPGATVSVNGLGECETPCTVELSQLRRVTVAKTGYKPFRFDLQPDGRDIAIELELAAPTEDVDAVALPDID